MNKFVKTVNNRHLYEEYLRALNGILHLTEREIELMVEFINFDINWESFDENEPKNVANTANRKYLQETLKVTRDNLSTFIKRLKEKGCLVESGVDSLEVNKALIPDIIGNKVVQIVMILRLAEDTNEQWR